MKAPAQDAAQPSQAPQAPSPASTPVPAASTTPATPAAPATPAQATPNSSTAYAVEQLRATVQLAASRGAAHARIQLRPAELGGLMIRMKATSEGMTASITAERPEAAAALDRAAADLKRSLEDRGVTLISLEVSVSADAGGGAAADRREDAAQRAAAAAGRSAAGGTNDPTDSTDDDLTAAPAVRLPAGALVDVHA